MLETKSRLQKLIEEKKFPQGVLIAGHPAETAELAGIIAALILQTDKPENHVDFIKLSGGQIEDTRLMLGKVKLAAFASRVVVVEKTEELTAAAVNNLLKAVEEPGQNNYFVFTTSHEASLLPTLRSRLTVFRLGQNAPAEVRGFGQSIAERLNAVSDLEDKEACQSLLADLYRGEISDWGRESGRRMKLILECFVYLKANINVSRVLGFLTLNW